MSKVFLHSVKAFFQVYLDVESVLVNVLATTALGPAQVFEIDGRAVEVDEVVAGD